MKVLLIGARGQLAQDILRVAKEQPAPAKDEIIPLAHEQVELRNEPQVAEAVQQAKPDCIINTAAFHLVDLCEDQPENAFAVNEQGVLNLARATQKQGALLVQFSTDYVFDGMKRSPYVESDEPRPQSVYAKSRLAGEQAVRNTCERYLLVRTCGLYGAAGSSSKAGNFVETMLRLGRAGRQLKVVKDQFCTPTATWDLAQRLLPLIRSGAHGLFHLTNTGECSWFEFAQEIFRLAEIKANLSACSSEEYAAKAKRPAYSVLDNRAFRKAGFEDLQSWQEALARYIAGRPRQT
jgi:dTDP-4-dehydrorhamnose reductase